MAPSPLLEPTRSALRRAAGILGGVLIVYPLLPELALRPRPEKLLLVVLEALTIGAAVMLAYALWDVVCDTIETRTQGYSTRAERLLVPMTRKFMRFMILVGGLLIALGAVFQVNIAGLIAGLGIGGLVIALAAKDSVENVFGSLTLLFDMPFAIGDWVKIDKIEGVVEEVNLRSTRIRTFEDTVINLPNANLIRASVENFGLRRMRRQKFYLRLSYDNDADKISALAQAIRDYLAAQDKVVTDKSIVELADLDETSMAMLVQCHFLADSLAEEMSMRAALMEQILRLRKQLKFDFVAAPRPKG
jgi:MscS family membrane protein